MHSRISLVYVNTRLTSSAYCPVFEVDYSSHLIVTTIVDTVRME